MKGNKRSDAKYRRGRSLILFQITVLVLVVVLISGGANLIIFRRSQNNLIEESKKKLIETEASVIASSHDFVSGFLPDFPAYKEVAAQEPSVIKSDLSSAVAEGRTAPIQQATNEVLKNMVDTGFFELDAVVEAVPPTETGPGGLIIFASDNSFMYKELPRELADLVENNGKSYTLLKDGVASLGLDGEHLVTFYKNKSNPAGVTTWYFDFKPMHQELAAIDDFYSNESSYINIVLASVVGGSIIVLAIITYLILSWLLKRKITKPIDELAAAAEQVMEGDLDAKVTVRAGEEFEGLKAVFNRMLDSINAVFMKSDEGESIEESAEKITPAAGELKKHKTRSRILIYITCLITIVFISSGIISFVVFSRSQSRLIQKSKEYIVRQHATLVASAHDFFGVFLEAKMFSTDQGGVDLATPEGTLKFLQESANALVTKTPSPAIDSISEVVRKVAETGLYEATSAVMVIPPTPPLVTKAIVFAASNSDDMFMELPETLSNLSNIEGMEDSGFNGKLNDHNAYFYFENGIPELGLEGETLVTFNSQEIVAAGSGMNISTWYYDFIPIGEEFEAINSFYSQENRNAMLQTGLVMLISTIVLIAISFFVLSYLIRKRITEPIDELADAAEQVANGNLDVQVPVRKGEEFEGLKNAFNEMIKSIRIIMSGMSK
ncbi:MAG: HAMP domain-containing protein [Actinobacteria bacterium]|nr:HAMP domain-containing protein [Actinomycetota bacterium]